MLRFNIIFFLIVCVAMGVAWPTNAATQQTWEGLLEANIKENPDIKHISTQDLDTWLNDAKKAKPILIDTRPKKEFKVSHLWQAKHAYFKWQLEWVLLGTKKTVPIVTYCSVGARSAATARYLQQKGYTQVYNLNGSMFGWVKEGRSVFRGKEEVFVVHPFDEYWGQYLDKKFHPN